MGYKLKRILIYPDGVTEKQVYPAGWKPNANTIAYYPLTSTTTVNDQSGNNQNLTNNNSVSFGTYQGVSCASFNGSSSYLSTTLLQKLSDYNFTISAWIYTPTQLSANAKYPICIGTPPSSSNKWQSIVLALYNDSWIFTFWADDLYYSSSPGYNSWNLFTMTYNKTSKLMTVYLNGASNNSRTSTYTLNLKNNNLTIGTALYTTNDDFFKGYISNVIVEKVEWNSTEASNYYNQTKSLYGL